MARLASILATTVLAAAASAASVHPADAADPSRDQRQAQAIGRCRDAVNAGGRDVVYWCDLAYQGMLLTKLDARKAELVFFVRWVTMVEARSTGSKVSTRKAIPKMADPRLAEAQSLAFDAVSMRQGFTDGWDGAAMLRLASIIGHEPVTGSLAAQRLTLLRAIANQPRDEATFWVVTVLAATWRMEYSDTAAPTREEARAYIKELIGLLTPLLSEARQLRGPARAIYPLIAAELVDLRSASDDYAGASALAVDSAVACRDLLWRGNALCMDLGLAGALARARGRNVAEHPEWVRPAFRPPVLQKGSLVQRSTASDGEPCRIAVQFDLDPAGSVINARVLYSEPVGLCEKMALDTVSRFVYEPETSSTPQSVRSDLVQAVVVRRP